MRKLMLALASVVALSLMGATVAFANGGPHGGYTTTNNDEDKCAGCHRAHSGYGRMLKVDGASALCDSCHNGTGVTHTNTRDGTDPGNAGAALNGGKFNAATSIHDVYSGTVTSVPDSTGTKVLARPLSCASCHDPHGRVFDGTGNLVYNYGPTVPAGDVEQYRMLTGYNGIAETVQVASNETTKDYTLQQWKSGTTQFCGSCHDLNMQLRDTNYAGVARHPVDVTLQNYVDDVKGSALTTSLPLQHPTAAAADNQVVCLTCHKPHGTTVTDAGSYSSGVTAQSPVVDTSNSYLLRMNNRGVCQDCHKK